MVQITTVYSKVNLIKVTSGLVMSYTETYSMWSVIDNENELIELICYPNYCVFGQEIYARYYLNKM